jgi:hypothetical protein
MQTSLVKDVPKSFQWKILTLTGHIWENSGYQTRQYVYKLGLIVFFERKAVGETPIASFFNK